MILSSALMNSRFAADFGLRERGKFQFFRICFGDTCGTCRIRNVHPSFALGDDQDFGMQYIY